MGFPDQQKSWPVPLSILKQIFLETQENGIEISVGQAVLWVIDQNMQTIVFINNSRTASPTKNSTSCLSFSDNFSPGCLSYIIFQNSVDDFEKMHKTWLNFCLRSRGWFSHWHGIRICACLLGRFFVKFGTSIGGFSSETKEPKLHKLGVFWVDYCKKHPIWSKLGAFLLKPKCW